MWKYCKDELPALVKPEKYGCPTSKRVIFLFANGEASVGHVYAMPDDITKVLIQNDSVLIFTEDWNARKSRLATDDDFEFDDEGYYKIRLGCTHGYIPDDTRWMELPD